MDIRLPVSYYSNFPIKCKCKNACFRYFITNNIAFAPLFSAFRERFRIVEFAHSLFQVPILLPAQRYPYKRKAENGTARRFRFPPAMPFLSIFSGGNEAHIGWSTRFRRIRGCRCVLKARAHLAVSSGTIAAAGACVPAGAVIFCGGFDHIAGACILGSRLR